MKEMNLKTAKIIRTVSVAPVMAWIMLTGVFIRFPEVSGGVPAYICMWFGLIFLPVSAYGLCKILPPYKEQGREGQRNLAIVMAVMGYIFCIAVTALFLKTKICWVISLTYMLSGVGMVIFNKLLHVRASGHICGVVGPAFLGGYYLGWPWLAVGIVLTLFVGWASLVTKRHTASQMVYGGGISAVMFFVSVLIAG